ncbi:MULTISPECIES: cbb3-type cytochrome oxidase assembly protein CcoS [Alteromonadaceae]|uniref:Cbb3-type cytochrome oxidase assembly protein CcoS n=1 Tax=Brumicola blandensis TaxID=3075611 RepID=A0AAW8QZQ3_9ALTE|nr:MULTISPECIES: cbb3-type cytochrome oxidase assembly protein CcoS [unclassified Alteromonas]MDT0581453.1 cbb3-type cytochrome oxidase assembly protein CcoS [Alteromonas sp. W409]MDT0627071.1 cbb3-type cytochrome oxidase assembly protein CcoS [Alteromonas sp. W364]
MSIIYVLIPLAIIIVGIAIGVFFWAVKSNQFEDLDRQGYSILFDDDIKSESAEKTNDAADSNANEQQAELAKDKKEPKR